MATSIEDTRRGYAEFVVLYTVRLTGPDATGRNVKLVYTTNDGEEFSTPEAEQSEAARKDKGKTDHTGVIAIWGPWSPRVRVLVDGAEAAEVTDWTERPADRYAEIEAPPNHPKNRF